MIKGSWGGGGGENISGAKKAKKKHFFFKAGNGEGGLFFIHWGLHFKQNF